MGEPDRLEEMRSAVISGDIGAMASLTDAALASGTPAVEIMNEGLIRAMSVVGQKFEQKEYFVPEVLVSARAMEESLSVLRPLLSASNVEPLARVAIGTVKGDLHDIGKNVVAMVLTGAGFAVENLGTNVSPETFAEAARGGAVAIGMSSLLTTTRPVMAQVIDLLRAGGLRETVKVVIGGAAVTPNFAGEIGADGFGSDAADAVRVFKGVLGL